jgi:TPR repeat protein
VKWYRQAAAQGDAVAQYNLGIMYAKGEGVPRDDVEAVKWYQQVAARGYAGAQYSLGVMYAKGEGVPRARRHESLYVVFSCCGAGWSAGPQEPRSNRNAFDP